MRLRLLLSVTLPIFPSVKKRILQYGVVSMVCLILKTVIIGALSFIFNLFNTHSGCKVRKFFVTLRS